MEQETGKGLPNYASGWSGMQNGGAMAERIG